MQPRQWVAVAVALAGLTLGLLAARRMEHHRKTGRWLGGSWGPPGWSKEFGWDDDDEEEAVVEDAGVLAWCAEGLTPIPGNGCLATPNGEGPWPLIMYLHGIFDPDGASEEQSRQLRVAAQGVAKGFAVLALRGHVGQCTSPEYASRVCWPSNERNGDQGPTYVAEWRTPLAVAGQRGATGHRYVFGFSNGGYFSGLLAERGWFDAGAFVVARGGPVSPVKAAGVKRPFMLTLSDADPSHDEMVKLDGELTEDEWPHEVFVSQGGHALPDADIEAAVAFFSRQEQAPTGP